MRMNFLIIIPNLKRIILFLFCIVLFSDCKKIMHEEETSIGKITNYEQLVSATDGVYGRLADVINSYDFYYANVKGDDLTFNPTIYTDYYNPGRDCYKNNIFYSIYPNVWSLTYKVLASTNNIVTQFNLSSVNNKKTKEILGEVYFLRAYCYFRLTRTYGEIPIINSIDINYVVPKSSFIKIYKFIENDLILAKSLLPLNNNNSRIPNVTPHRGTAKALLSELYLSWAGYPIKDISKYTLAAKEASETIDSSSYFGFGLVNDFAYLWDSTYFYNPESVFTIFFSKPSDNPSDLSLLNNLYIGSISNIGFITAPGMPLVNLYFPPTEVNFFNSYPAGYRKDITFFNNIYVPYDSEIKRDTGYFHITHISNCNRIGYRKIFYQPYLLSKYPQYYGNHKVYILRYAQTLLTYAEAMSRSGNLNAHALECVNQIRRRSHHLDLNSPSVFDLQPGLSSEAFNDSVVWERAWELCGEPEGRWFDLVRLEMVENLPKIRDPKEGGPPNVFDKSVYYFTIPSIDTLFDPNLRMK